MKSEEKEAQNDKFESKEPTYDKNDLEMEAEIKQLPNDIGWEEEEDL